MTVRGFSIVIPIQRGHTFVCMYCYFVYLTICLIAFIMNRIFCLVFHWLRLRQMKEKLTEYSFSLLVDSTITFRAETWLRDDNLNSKLNNKWICLITFCCDSKEILFLWKDSFVIVVDFAWTMNYYYYGHFLVIVVESDRPTDQNKKKSNFSYPIMIGAHKLAISKS